MIQLGIQGISGRMGRAVVALLENNIDFKLVGAMSARTSIHEIICQQFDQPTQLLREADVIIDFSHPSSTQNLVKTALKEKKYTPLIIGTTGLDALTHTVIQELSEHTPLILSTNTSVGIAIVRQLIGEIATVLDASFDVEIVETHHRHKIDAPSGTALTLAQRIADVRSMSLEDALIPPRQGVTGPRPDGKIGISAVRGGHIIGDHDVSFVGEEEVITISHRALSRAIFAKGALRAARWVVNQSPGLYSMQDVLFS